MNESNAILLLKEYILVLRKAINNAFNERGETQIKELQKSKDRRMKIISNTNITIYRMENINKYCKYSTAVYSNKNERWNIPAISCF